MKKVWVVADLKDFSWDDFLLGYMVGGVLMGSATEVVGRKKSGSDITVKIFDKKEDMEKFLDEKRKKRVPVVFGRRLCLNLQSPRRSSRNQNHLRNFCSVNSL